MQTQILFKGQITFFIWTSVMPQQDLHVAAILMQTDSAGI